MFVMTENANPFNYMSDLWYVLLIVLVLVAVLFLIARPLHKIYTDRKTRQIIKESGVEEDTGGSADRTAHAAPGEGEEAGDD